MEFHLRHGIAERRRVIGIGAAQRKGGRKLLAIGTKPFGNRPSATFRANEWPRRAQRAFALRAKGRLVEFLPAAKRAGIVGAKGFL